MAETGWAILGLVATSYPGARNVISLLCRLDTMGAATEASGVALKH